MSRLGPWLNERRCSSCHAVLSKNARTYSDGRCPFCGVKGKHAGTIVDTTEHAYRLERVGKWWEFWKRGRRMYRDEKR